LTVIVEDARLPNLADFADSYQRVLDWLEERDRIRNYSVEAVQRAAQEKREPIILSLNRLGAVDDDDVRAAFCAVTGLPAGSPVCAEHVRDDPRVKALSPDFMKLNRAIVLDIDDDTARVGLVDPLNRNAIDGLTFALKCDLEICVLRARDERRLHAERVGAEGDGWTPTSDGEENQTVRRALEFDRDAPIARRLSAWLSQAIEQRASDVHIEPRAHSLTIRFRIDGVLQMVAREPVETATAIIARVKVLADLDLGERRAAQDGRTTIFVGGRSVDLRVSIVPSVHGETAVLRILDRGEIDLSFQSLGFSPPELDLLNEAVGWPHGLFLVTGPTGSGKTTTIYAGLEALRGGKQKILTVEDPVEYYFDHVTQVQVSAKTGVTFASSIRSFLRQDPDVILVGEIRDIETARAAIRAALTGHLVLATLHAIDAPRALPRLLDMGVEPFQLSACFRGSLAQRLVRQLCNHCKTERKASEAECSEFGLDASETVWDPLGCVECGETGYRGRLAIAEGFRSNDEIAACIRRQDGLEAAALENMAHRLNDDALTKVRAGVTSMDELKRGLSG
jgi:general secretion pathway protein E